jgi:predicted nucleotidyltransferase
MKAREGDVIRDLNGMLFDVKGLAHPRTKIIAFPRFIPDSHGNRVHAKIAYKKIYGISERFNFLEKHFPQYIVYDPVFGEKLCEVPIKNVKRHHQPANHLQQLRHAKRLDKLEKDALDFLKLLKATARIFWNKIGISGSLLVKLHTTNSDIDPVIYGSENCRKVHETLKFFTENTKNSVKPYTLEELQKLYEFRVKDTAMSFEDFVRTESRKVLQGKFKSREYFIRFVKDWNEVEENYGTVQYRNVGHARIRAEIADDAESIFTPCVYKIENAQVLEGSQNKVIREIVSFRGRFCEQAKTGESVIAQGKVEHVKDTKRNSEHFRLLLGNKPSDYMILA